MASARSAVHDHIFEEFDEFSLELTTLDELLIAIQKSGESL